MTAVYKRAVLDQFHADLQRETGPAFCLTEQIHASARFALRRSALPIAVICSLLMLGDCSSGTARPMPPFGDGGSDSGGGGMGGH